MSDIFSGLEDLGFKNVKLNIFEKEEENKREVEIKNKTVDTFLYEKTILCPVCSTEFKSKALRNGKTRRVGSDTDLMPIYQGPNPLFYDVHICPSCGYSALNQYFEKVKQEQALLIKSVITPKFRPKNYPEVYDENIAIERYKLALLNAVVKKAKSSEKAFICLKIAWMYRLLQNNSEERKFLEQAYVGFKESFETEAFPICSMDNYTLSYLIGELARRLGDNDEALLWFSKVIVTPGVNPRLKEMARDQKDLIKESAL
ncbi:MAG: hypothetical protein JG776_2048 [Caloramator sp.]|jgi:hypothetical protein|uniref:DUF2225 domain-containing protein n=1 Tax=Caloramator sp. TaxID=1871330 RepID=UPI001DE3B63E|nr:DUF2225 domain-containing protein [Caloramator sp.]MBZ4664330.1 hypothetical protein [Caloramator sp.]